MNPDPEHRLPSPLQRHYAGGQEAGRLESGSGRLEWERTCELLRRFLPPAPARVADVGGGPGRYAVWLASLGYEVRLLDLVPLHVTQAREALTQAGAAGAGAGVGDARALPFANATQDAVLLLGPLYHLPEREDRLRALAEARRVLRPGGVLAAAAISRFASLLAGFAEGLVGDPAFVAILDADLATGRHENPTDRAEYFTTAYLHYPDELTAELGDAGFADIRVLAVEGPFWALSGFEQTWADDGLRGRMLEYLRRVEAEPALLGAGAHLLAIARQPQE